MPDFLKRFGELQSDGSYAFSTVRSGLIVGLLSIGTLVGALVAAPIADKFGRRPSICFWSVIVAVGFVIQVAANTSWEQFMIGRLVAGFGVGALSLLVPMFQAETAPPWIRGALVCTYQLFITLGIFLAACFNYGTYEHQRDNSGSWRIVVGLGWIWTLILGVGIWGFKETPRYVYRLGRTAEAKETLQRVYGAPDNHYAIFVQMEELEHKFRAEMAQKGTGPIAGMVDMFKAPRMAYRIALGIMLQMFQQLTGANYFFYYGTVCDSHFVYDGCLDEISELICSTDYFQLCPNFVLRDTAHPQRHQLWCHLHRPVPRRALRSTQVSRGRLHLDVRVLYDICLGRSLRP